MMDPTIYENLKVVLEGSVYDLDLKGEIAITGRDDIVHLSSMSRTYILRLTKQEGGHAEAEIRLHAGMEDLASEILELNGEFVPGCQLDIRFKFVHNLSSGMSAGQNDGKDQEWTDGTEKAALVIQSALAQIWGTDIRLEHSVSYSPSEDPRRYTHQVTVDFNRKIDEQHIDDLTSLLAHIIRSLEALDKLAE